MSDGTVPQFSLTRDQYRAGFERFESYMESHYIDDGHLDSFNGLLDLLGATYEKPIGECQCDAVMFPGEAHDVSPYYGRPGFVCAKCLSEILKSEQETQAWLSIPEDIREQAQRERQEYYENGFDVVKRAHELHALRLKGSL